MAFEKLDLDGDDKQPNAPLAASGEHVQETIIQRQTVDLRSQVKPGATDEEIAFMLAETPIERFNPFHKVMLPSRGLWYGWDSGYVEARAMDQEADKILSTEQLIRSGQAIDMVLRNFTRLPEGFDVLDLVNGDRIYLLYYLRGITHGNLYEFMATCGACENTGIYKYDLNDLQSTVEYGNPKLGPEPFKVNLPVFSATVGKTVYAEIRWPRGRDTQQIVANMRLKSKIQPGMARATKGRRNDVKAVSDAATDNLESLIVSINGSQDRMVIASCVEKMHQSDTAVIRKWINDNMPGPDTSVMLSCQGCDNEFEIPLPITESFFRPTQQ